MKRHKSLFTILALILFFPLGLFLMYKYTKWRLWVKNTVTIFFLSLTALTIFGWIVAPPNLELVDLDAKETHKTASSSYGIEGQVYPYDSKVTINGQSVAVESQGKFNYDVPLKEGKNDVTVVAKGNSKTTQESYKVYRYTASDIEKQKQDARRYEAEIKEQAIQKAAADQARKAAIAQKAAADAAKRKAEAEKQAAEQKASQDQAQQEAAAVKARKDAATKAKSAPKPVIQQLWGAYDKSLHSRKGVKISWDEQTKIAKLTYYNNDFWNEKSTVTAAYTYFVGWGERVKNIPGVETIETTVSTDFIDSYGNSKPADAVSIAMQTSDFKKFNWKNLEGRPIHNQLRSTELGYMYINPVISRNVNLNRAVLVYF